MSCYPTWLCAVTSTGRHGVWHSLASRSGRVWLQPWGSHSGGPLFACPQAVARLAAEFGAECEASKGTALRLACGAQIGGHVLGGAYADRWPPRLPGRTEQCTQ